MKNSLLKTSNKVERLEKIITGVHPRLMAAVITMIMFTQKMGQFSELMDKVSKHEGPMKDLKDNKGMDSNGDPTVH